MKIILREHVDHLGQRGEIVNVAPGYARNYLLPKGLAYQATPGNIKQLEHQRRLWDSRDMKEQEEADALAKRLEQLELTVVHKAGDSGTLYGSVTSSEVGALLAERGIDVDRRKLEIGDPIKSLGEYEIRVKLHPKVTGRVRLNVLAEEQAD